MKLSRRLRVPQPIGTIVSQMGKTAAPTTCLEGKVAIMRASVAAFGILLGVGGLACGPTELVPGGGGAGSGGGSGGMSGAAGFGGAAGSGDGGGATGVGRVLYTGCSTVGALDCSSQDPAIRLLCDGMTWIPIAKCGLGLGCDTQLGPNHGLCAPSDAGTSGAVSGESPPGVVLYTACSTLGALDCSLANSKVQVLCDGMTWNPIGECSGQLVCDTSSGPDQGLCTESDAGTSGGVSGESPPGVVLYTACSTLGALDCSLANPKVQVLCDGMTWNPIGECSGQLVCDTSSGPDQGLCTAPDRGISDAGSGD